MTSRKDDKKTTTSGASSSAKDQAESKASSAAPKAQNTKTSSRPASAKPVTIDLEAKDITPKDAQETTSDKTPFSKAEMSQPAVAKAGEKEEEKSTSPATDKKTADKKNDIRAQDGTSDDKGRAGVSAAEPANSKRADEAKKSEAGSAVSPPPTPTVASRSSAVFPAVIGGVIAVGGFILLQMIGIVPSNNGDAEVVISRFESRLAALENSTQTGSIDPARLDAISARVGSVEERVSGVAKAAEEAGKTASEAVMAVSELAGQGAEIPAELTARLGALEARLNDLEAKGIATVTETGESNGVADTLPVSFVERMSALEVRLAAAESGLNDVGASAVEKNTVLNEAVSGLRAEISVLNAEKSKIRIDGLTGETEALRDDVAKVLERVAALSAQQNQLAETATMLDQSLSDIMGRQVAGLEEEIARLENNLVSNADIVTKTQTAAQTVALANLQTVISHGGNFEHSLAALRNAGVSEEHIGPLIPFADKGLRSRAELSSSLGELIGRAASLENPASKSAVELSAFEKLLQNATTAINIRKVDEAVVNDDAPLAQLRQAFEANNADQFMAILSTLQDNQKALFAIWQEEWKAYLALQAVMDDFADAFILSQSPADADNANVQ